MSSLTYIDTENRIFRKNFFKIIERKIDYLLVNRNILFIIESSVLPHYVSENNINEIRLIEFFTIKNHLLCYQDTS